MEFERVAEEASLGEGRLVSAQLGTGERVCLIRVNGEIFAVADRCTHAEYPLSEGSLEGDYHLECALHGAVFDVRDGSVQSPPAEESVKTYEVKLEDGAIWVRPGE
jgi:3-phenylpropionate/trans-cinnamate dioxygenase ferredoxin subunit